MMTPQALLSDIANSLVNRYQPHILEIDLHPFYEGSPTISNYRNIGQGLAFLNHYLCNQFLTDPQYWLEILFQTLRGLHYDHTRLLLNDRIESGVQLAVKIHQALKFLNERPPNEPYEKFRFDLQD